jgi:hypothetical protein
VPLGGVLHVDTFTAEWCSPHHIKGHSSKVCVRVTFEGGGDTARNGLAVKSGPSAHRQCDGEQRGWTAGCRQPCV